MNRKITFDQKKEPPIEKIVLKKLVGFASDHGILVFEDTITEEWMGIYTSTGAKIKLTNRQLPIVDWGRDDQGKQIEEVKKIYEFIEPPPKKSPIHADNCECEDCKELNQAKEYVDDFGQPGD